MHQQGTVMKDSVQAPFCVKCGHRLEPLAAFCHNCGTQRVPQPGAAPVHAAKRYQRSRRHRLLGGVLGGLAAYWNVDVAVIRIAWMVIAFLGLGLSFGGLTFVLIVVYVALWLFTPEKSSVIPL
jgi:phage shock protein PspC (stress-responsive transcriptional regulator)/ribosomal protein L40E